MPAKEFRALEAEAEGQIEGLCTLSRELCRQLLQGLDAVMREEETLQALEDSVSLGGRQGGLKRTWHRLTCLCPPAGAGHVVRLCGEAGWARGQHPGVLGDVLQEA